MLLVLIAASVTLAAFVWRSVRRSETPATWVRLVTLVIALGAAGGGIAGIVALARDRDESSFGGYALFAVILVGGLLYAVGTALWRGRPAMVLRAIGWGLMVMPLALSWMVVFFLPLAAALFATVTNVPAARAVTAASLRRAGPAGSHLPIRS